MSSRPRASSVRSQSSRASERNRRIAPLSMDDSDRAFEACAATASFFLFAQRSNILCLHHDTLAVERKFEKHKEDVLLLSADNVSERGAGRLIASYDVGQTAIVWDLFTGDEVARFSSYEPIRVAAWMRDGSLAFGNSQGSIVLFETSTSEHISTRTIFDPITALSPASDCRTFAIGYQNGSILVATLQPSFTILHTLTTARAPSPIIGLAWHGSSSKQKSDMLATQTQDGDLRVWSVSKAPHVEPPRVIRVLGSPEMVNSTRNWFSWSKNGRIVNHCDGETRAWDVRTKRIANETVPTIDNVIAIANYGPTAALFTVGVNHTVQQYDLLSHELPIMVANVQHVPPNAPPTPPDSIEEAKLPRAVPMKIMTSEPTAVSIQLDIETSEDEGPVLSPLQRIAREMDELEDERRDQLAPLSPVSSRASMSSASSYGRPRRHRSRTLFQTTSEEGSEGTIFSDLSTPRSGRESISIRSGTSVTSSRHQSSALRQMTMRNPEESKQMKLMDLFPFTKARLSEVKFRTPRYGQQELTSDVLRREMISVIFGFDDDIENLVRDEQSRHKSDSASAVLLSKWLGDFGADSMAQMIGSETMTSSDWMLLALLGSGSQKQAGEVFVRRLLETNEIHPAVAILLGLGEQNEAVEVYVSRNYYMEAVLLTCLVFPKDWQRQSFLVRKWGEEAVTSGQPELAVRCFSCTTIESSEPWFSPKSQDMVYQAQQRLFAPDPTSPPLSPPSAGGSRMTTKLASLKLITSFGDKGVPKPQQTVALGTTPIDSAITPATRTWQRSSSKGPRDVSETRTATPGGYQRNKMLSATHHADMEANPLPGRQVGRKGTPALSDSGEPVTAMPNTAIENTHTNRFRTMSSPAAGIFDRQREMKTSRAESRERNHHGLHIEAIPTVEKEEVASPDPSLASIPSEVSRGRHGRSNSWQTREATHQLDVPPSEEERMSPAPPLSAGGSMKSYKGRSIDRYISSLEEANFHAQQHRSESWSSPESRDARSRSRIRLRDASQTRAGQQEAIAIKPGKRSPSSPKSMTAEDAGKYASREHSDENHYCRTSPVDSKAPRIRGSSKAGTSRARAESLERPTVRSGSRAASRNVSRANSRQRSPDGSNHGRTEVKDFGAGAHSPTSPTPMESQAEARSRQRSTSRRPNESRARSSSRRPNDTSNGDDVGQRSPEMATAGRRPRAMSRKELAANELEARRLSLARRTPIPQPGEYSGRPIVSPRSTLEAQFLSRSFAVDPAIDRSQTVDPEAMLRYTQPKTSGTSTALMPIGLPATPRAMRHPRYMSSDPDDKDKIPAVPALPDNLQTLAPVSYQPASKASGDVGPLLPSTVYGQRPPLFRAASAPPENLMGNQNTFQNSPPRPERQQRDSASSRPQPHTRRASERDIESQRRRSGSSTAPEVVTSIDATLNCDDNIIVVGEVDFAPVEYSPVLAELAHLAGPPPPPPPPTMFQQPPNSTPSGVINIALENNSNGHSTTTSRRSSSLDTNNPTLNPKTTPQIQPLTAANLQRRNGSTDDSKAFGSKWRSVADRMRSGSRSRNATRSPPPPQHQQQPFAIGISIPDTAAQQGAQAPNFAQLSTSPYETQVVLPSTAFSRTKSPQSDAGSFRPGPAPYETNLNTGGYDSGNTVPPPPHMGVGATSELSSLSNTSDPSSEKKPGAGGSVYRNPKEIRANMPPQQLQPGVYQQPPPPSQGIGVAIGGGIDGGMI